MPNVIIFLESSRGKKKKNPNPDTVNIHIICYL